MAQPASPDAEAKRVASLLARLERSSNDVANGPSVGLYYVREHVRSSAPGLSDSCKELKASGKDLQAGVYASQGASDFATTLRSSFLTSMHRMQRTLTDACAAANACRLAGSASSAGTAFSGGGATAFFRRARRATGWGTEADEGAPQV